MGSFSNSEGVGGADCKFKKKREVFIVPVSLREQTSKNETDLTTFQN